MSADTDIELGLLTDSAQRTQVREHVLAALR